MASHDCGPAQQHYHVGGWFSAAILSCKLKSTRSSLPPPLGGCFLSKCTSERGTLTLPTSPPQHTAPTLRHLRLSVLFVGADSPTRLQSGSSIAHVFAKGNTRPPQLQTNSTRRVARWQPRRRPRCQVRPLRHTRRPRTTSPSTTSRSGRPRRPVRPQCHAETRESSAPRAGCGAQRDRRATCASPPFLARAASTPHPPLALPRDRTRAPSRHAAPLWRQRLSALHPTLGRIAR